MKRSQIKRSFRRLWHTGSFLLLLAHTGLVFSAAPPDPEKFEKESLALRTALHYDPAQAASLDRLISLYKESGRLEELIGMYQAHTTEFPADNSALIVLIQIFRSLNDARAEALLATAMARQEENALVTYLQYQQWSAQQDPRATETLAKAIAQEKNLARKRQWTLEFIRLAKTQGQEALATPILEALIQEKGQSAGELIALGREILGAGHAALARTAIATALALNPDPESLLEAEVIAAQADQAQGKSTEAATRLEALLAKVAADHWRRAELIQLRLTLTKNDAEKRQLLDKARARFEQNPQDENAARELGELLQAADLQREALTIFLAASKRFPRTELLERQTLDLFDRLGDVPGAEAFLKERLAADPARADLALRLVRTLFAAGKSAEARAGLDKLLAGLPEEQRADRLVEMGRQLRRNALPAEAAGLLEQAVQSLPQRIDLRRELAETYLALGRRSDAGALFAKGIDPAAPVEFATDLVQFLVNQGFLAEARQLLEARAKVAPLAFELELVFLDIHGQLGNFPDGDALLTGIRPKADTEARYASWLQSGLKFHEAFDRLPDFLSGELAQVKAAKKPGEPWPPLLFQQFLIVCDAASRQPGSKLSVESLRELLRDQTLVAEQAARVRGLLFSALSKDAAAADEVQSLLVEMMSSDQTGASLDLNRLRLAQIYDKAQRGDLARQALEQARPEVMMESGDLAACWSLYLKYNLTDRAQAAIIRLTTLDPGNMAHWEKRLSLQARLGDEVAFRQSIRQILAGLKDVKLADESLDQLRKHLEVSYWRGMVRRFQKEAEPEAGTLTQILEDLQAIARSRALEPQEAAWVLWARAWVLARLNRPEERDAAMAQLQEAEGKADLKYREEAAQREAKASQEKEAEKERLASLGGTAAPPLSSIPVPGAPANEPEPAAEEEKAFAGPVIRFPDGLNLSLDSALTLLKEPALLLPPEPAGASGGPVGSLATAWSFAAPAERAIWQIIPQAAGQLAVLQDSAGGVAVISLQTGKLLWQEGPAKGEATAAKNSPPLRGGPSRRIYASGGGYYTGGGSYYPPRYQNYDPTGLAMLSLAPPMAAADGQLFTWEEDTVVCRELGTGQVQWQAPFESNASSATTPVSPCLAAGDGRLYLAFPGAGRALALDPKSGKVLWQAVLPKSKSRGNTPVYPLAQGLACSQGLVLVYGGAPTLLEAATGRVRWSLQEGNEPTFPVSLKSAETGQGLLDAAREKAPKWAAMPNAMGMGGQTPSLYLAYSQLQSSPAAAFMQQTSHMVSLANSYLQPNAGPVFGVLAPDRLLLMTENSMGAFSLKLPMGGTSFDMNGMYLGAAQDKVAFLTGSTLNVVAMDSEKVLSVLLKETLDAPLPQLGAYQGCVSGARVYVTGLKGVGIWQIHTGARIGFIPWPKEWEKEAARIKPVPKPVAQPGYPYYAGNYQGNSGLPGAHLNRRGSIYQPGFSQNGMTTGVTVAPRCWVAGDLLIAALSPELVIALRAPASAP